MHPTGGSRRVFRQVNWLEAGSVKVALSHPTHQRVTPAVRRTNSKSVSEFCLSFGIEFGRSRQFFLAVAFLQFCIWVLSFNSQVFKFSCFSFGGVLFVGNFHVWLRKVVKIGLSFLVGVVGWQRFGFVQAGFVSNVGFRQSQVSKCGLFSLANVSSDFVQLVG